MKESSVDRIFSKSPEEARTVRGVIEKRFREQKNISFKTERGKTPEELELINFIDTETDALAKKFGGAGLHINPANVRIVGEDEFGDFIKKTRGENATVPEAMWSPKAQAIIMKDPGNDLGKFINVLTHEMHHAKAFQSLGFNLEKKNMNWRRGGLAIVLRENSKEAFVDLDEAVTEYLTYMNIGGWQQKKENVPEIINKTAEKFGESDLYSPVYLQEQLRFVNVLDTIQKKNHERFKDKDDVFSVFAEAYFTGKLLELRKTVDGAFGKGSFVEFAKRGLPESKWEKEL